MMTAQGEKKRLLLVDDAAENLRILGESLRDTYTIMFARNGQDALRLANGDLQPDIILLDVVMPGMDGYEVCRRLKKANRTKNIPIMFITAQNEEANEALALSLGVEDYIKKPFQISIVRNRVDNQLKFKMFRDELQQRVDERTRDLAERTEQLEQANEQLGQANEQLEQTNKVLQDRQEELESTNAKLMLREKELETTQVATIHAMASLAEWRDPETGAHIKRTQKYVRALAEVLAKKPEYADVLTPDTIERLEVSAPLHDVGKVAIRDTILLKAGKLEPEEFDEMKKHTEHGHELLDKAEEELLQKAEELLRTTGKDKESLKGDAFLHTANEIAYSHHERWDGKGYPQGLKETEIPLSARIMSVADVYDALRSRRVYKPAMPHEKAASIILEGRGTQFDPDVVDAFMSIQDQLEEIAENNSDADNPEDARKVGLIA